MPLIEKLKETLGSISSYKTRYNELESRCGGLELKLKEQEKQMEEAERIIDQILEELE